MCAQRRGVKWLANLAACNLSSPQTQAHDEALPHAVATFLPQHGLTVSPTSTDMVVVHQQPLDSELIWNQWNVDGKLLPVADSGLQYRCNTSCTHTFCYPSYRRDAAPHPESAFE